MNTSPISIIGIPLDLGAENHGVAQGPAAMRQHGLIEKLTSAGLNVTDTGDITPRQRTELEVGNPKLRYLDEIVRISNDSAQKAEATVKAGQRLVGLGGDHSLTLGLMSGVSTAVNGNLGLIYFDAHGDMNTAETSPSGNIHGMCVASLMGFGEPQLAQVHTPAVKLAKQNLLHIGGCDFDQAELSLVKNESLNAYFISDVLTKGLGPLLAQINALADRVDHLYVSVDLDSIDSQYAPGAGMPNQGGLTYREVAMLAGHIGATGKVLAADVVEYNPLQDPDFRTAELSAELIAKLFGANYSWYANYLKADKSRKA